VKQVFGAQRSHQGILHDIVGYIGVASKSARIAPQRRDCRFYLLPEFTQSIVPP
jgi:hypothetical protein